MEQFNQEELKNILALINLAPIKGTDALTVAILQQKIAKLIEPAPTDETVPAPTKTVAKK